MRQSAIVVMVFSLMALSLAACGRVATPEPDEVVPLITEEAEEPAETEEATIVMEPTEEPTEIVVTTEEAVSPVETAAVAPPPAETEEVFMGQQNRGQSNGMGQQNRGQGNGMGHQNRGGGGMMNQSIENLIANSDVENGRAIFNQQYETSVGPWICASCHSVDESQTRLVGPGLWGLYERADDRAAEAGVPNAIAYLHQSINMPQAYIVPPDDAGPYPENLMPPNYSELLTRQELDDVTAYMLTLGNLD